MSEPFAGMLAVGGRSNSLGRVDEVIALVLDDPSRLDELYLCLFDDDAWVRMRAADALEKVCRVHPSWLVGYVERFRTEVAATTQPSIQWHLAQIYRQVPLTAAQKDSVIAWLEELLSSTQVDWIVAANAMQTLAAFVEDGSVPVEDFVALLRTQGGHRSTSVVRRAEKWLAMYGSGE